MASGDADGALGLIADAASPIAIIGGAGRKTKARVYFQQVAGRIWLPFPPAFLRQGPLSPHRPGYVGNFRYCPNP